MSSDMWMTSTTERDHEVILTIPGVVENLRPSILKAVERLSYKLTGEHPVVGKRKARGSARVDCSFETLDYPRTLTVALKQVNEVTTLATFSYEIKAYTGLCQRSRRTLDSEARAIVAIATQRGLATACSSCGTGVSDDSRFCRRCGALVVVDVAELEVLRLMEDSGRGYRNLVMGAFVSLVALLLPITLIWIDTTKAYRVVAMLSSVMGILGLITLLHGIWQMHRALNPLSTGKALEEAPRTLSSRSTKALPLRQPNFSVMEGTTDLLDPGDKVPEPVPMKRKAADTSEVR